MPHLDENGCSFEAYEEEWVQLTSRIQRDLGRIMHNANNSSQLHKNENSKEAAQRRSLQILLDRSQILLVQLNVEARNAGRKNEKKELLSRVKLYKIQIDALQQHFADIVLSTELHHDENDDDDVWQCSSNDIGKQKENQVANPPQSTNKEDSAQRQPDEESSNQRNSHTNPNGSSNHRNLSTRLQLNQQNSALERARQSVADMEHVAGDISEELHRQRESIDESHNKLHNVTGMVNDANRIVTRMKKRWFT